MDRHLLISLLFTIGFTIGIGETAATITQSSQLDNNLSRNSSTLTNTTDIKISSDDKRITLIWLEPNETQGNKSQVFTIDKYDFWKIFNQLYEPSNNNKTVRIIE